MAQLAQRSHSKLNTFYINARYVLVNIYFLIALFEPYLNGVIGSVTKYYILFLSAFLLFSKKRFYFTRFQLIIFAWFLYKCASLIWTTDTYIATLHFFSLIGAMLLLYALTFNAESIDEPMLQSIMFTNWIGSFIIGFLSVFMSHPYKGKSSARQVLVLFGQEADPNNQAALVLIGFSIALYYLLILKKFRIFAIITVFANAYSLFLTGSRGGFAGAVAVILAIVLLATKDLPQKQRVKTFVILGLIGIAIFAGSYLLLDREIFNRIFVFSDYEGGSGRDDIWQNAFDLLKTRMHWLFGAGWGAYWNFNNFNVMIHNTFLSIVCDTGLFGLALFMAPMVHACIVLMKKKEFLPILFLITGFSSSFFLEAINKRFFWNVIFYLFMYYQYVCYHTPKNGELTESDAHE